MTREQALENTPTVDTPTVVTTKRTEKHTETHTCDYISRQAAIDVIETTSFDDYGDYVRIRELIEELPSAQRKGKWMFSPDHAEGMCTCCNYKIYGRPYQNTYLIVPYNYCPNCGAEMKGEEDE